MTFDTKETLDAVYAERLRQEELRKAGKFLWTCADVSKPDALKLAVLAEEFGEVAREVTEEIILFDKCNAGLIGRGPVEGEELQQLKARLKQELIQVAAVAVAWAESL